MDPKATSRPSLASETPHRGARADLHCHSHASSGPAMAALGFINCPECYSPPEKVYEQARARGMDFVTITDHDTISGAMELVERGFENFVVGEEVTVFFPEDRCKLHVLVWGITPEQHEAIHTLGLRDDVYQFAPWLREHNLAHALAHPLYIQNRRLGIWHIERAALLFRGFETLNGAHSVTHRRALERFLDTLTPARISALVRTHRMEPTWPEPWRKARTGGSDDHALLNTGRAWTQVEAPVGSPREFLKEVMACRSEAGGLGGHASLLAHQLNTVGWAYAAKKMRGRGRPRQQYGRAEILRLFGCDEPRPGPVSLAWDTFKRKVLRLGKPSHPLLGAMKRDLPGLLDRHPEIRRRLDPATWTDGSPLAAHEEMEAFSIDLVRTLTASMAHSARGAWRDRRRADAMRELTGLIAAQAVQIPYIFSLLIQNKERWLVDRLEHRLASSEHGPSPVDRPLKVTLFTDTLGDVNGVTRFIRTMGEKAAENGHCLTIITSTDEPVPDAPWVHNFKPLERIDLPGYKDLRLALPPVVEMLRFIDHNRPDVVHLSTPGPVGLVGRLAAKVARAPVVATYHTDFPAFVDRIFDDHSITSIATSYMQRFYERTTCTLTRSRGYVGRLAEIGVSPSKLRALPGACDTEAFHPRHRDTSIWRAHGLGEGSVKVLCCGRVSVEKNLPLLAGAWREAHGALRERGVEADLVVVGDGPYRQTMERELKGQRAVFLGFREGEELSELYASCDLLVFPSETDTLGQVVLEAQASGLAALVSEVGGPSEVIRDGVTGRIVRAAEAPVWARAIVDLVTDKQMRDAMGRAAREHVQPMTIDAMYRAFWGAHEDAWRDTLKAEGLTPETEGADIVKRAAGIAG